MSDPEVREESLTAIEFFYMCRESMSFIRVSIFTFNLRFGLNGPPKRRSRTRIEIIGRTVRSDRRFSNKDEDSRFVEQAFGFSKSLSRLSPGVDVSPSLRLSISPSLRLSDSPTLRLDFPPTLRLDFSPTLRLDFSLTLRLDFSLTLRPSRVSVSHSLRSSLREISLSLSRRLSIRLCLSLSLGDSRSTSEKMSSLVWCLVTLIFDGSRLMGLWFYCFHCNRLWFTLGFVRWVCLLDII
ncbi:hypothetical protein F2Q69_00003244 [Brassica cretica]|uniref:Uncharacterized protein n=1 Tax=Brassica cretica TaxID=69181 RepID=A0A8S9PFV1_BRACR|nr:hypothetical protein F2Q69_00003244 [Brassica cretica]